MSRLEDEINQLTLEEKYEEASKKKKQNILTYKKN